MIQRQRPPSYIEVRAVGVALVNDVSKSRKFETIISTA